MPQDFTKFCHVLIYAAGCFKAGGIFACRFYMAEKQKIRKEREKQITKFKGCKIKNFCKNYYIK